MLKKIISGCQTGADHAALDTAIKLGIPHGGWIPKGCITEIGPLPDKYQLQELPTDSYSKSIEQNVIDSDGTLIVARGKLTEGINYTRHITMKHKKQLLGIDLNRTNHYAGANLTASWIRMQHIQVLYVAGPRASEDSSIYSDVLKILELATQMLRDEKSRSEANPIPLPSKPPETVDAVVERLLAELPLKDKTSIANMAKEELADLYISLGFSIRNRFLFPNNEKLLESCRHVSQHRYLDWDQASIIIIQRLWKELMGTHKLRIVASR